MVDLGCGSGLLTRELARAHYDVLGIDISEEMIAIARRRVPDAEFRVGSLFDADIPPCEAVVALGEVFNYLFEAGNDIQRLILLFRRIIFDIAEPGQIASGTMTREFSEGEDWAVLIEKEEDRERSTLTRRIVTFREVGECYRRADEVPRQRLYKATDVAEKLRLVGFRVRTTRSYGRYDLPKAHAAFVARKPA